MKSLNELIQREWWKPKHISEGNKELPHLKFIKTPSFRKQNMMKNIHWRKQDPNIFIARHFAKKAFSGRSRKPLNPYPTLTQQHRGPCENNQKPGSGLRPVLRRETDKGILISTWNSLPRGVEPKTWGVLLESTNQLS
jgi:hypothetical protein